MDTHVHVWDPAVLRYPWLDEVPALNQPALPSSIDRTAGATAMIHVQADCAPEQAAAEIAWVRGLRWPELAGIVAFADLRALGGLTALEAGGGSTDAPVVGVRQILRGWPDTALHALAPALAHLGAAGLAFDATVERGQLAALAVAHARAEQVTIVLDHLGDPPLDAGWDAAEAVAWRAGILAVAENPAAVVKVSGLPAAFRSRATWAHTDRFVRHALDAFGPARTMLGSDWPVTAPVAEGGVAWHRVLDAAVAGDPDAHSRVLGGTAEAAYRLRVRPERGTASE